MTDLDIIEPDKDIRRYRGRDVLQRPSGMPFDPDAAKPGYNTRGFQDVVDNSEAYGIGGDEGVIIVGGVPKGRFDTTRIDPRDALDEARRHYGRGTGVGTMGPAPGTAGETFGDGFEPTSGLEKKLS